MSGFYNVHQKVLHQGSVLPQMTSNGFQAPFYFGGSQVPTALGIDNSISGSGIKQRRKVKGKAVQETNYDRTLNIHLPRHLVSIKK